LFIGHGPPIEVRDLTVVQLHAAIAAASSVAMVNALIADFIALNMKGE